MKFSEKKYLCFSFKKVLTRFACCAKITWKSKKCACSSVDRVPGYEPVGRGFESPQARQKKALALASAFFNEICPSVK